MFNLWNPLWWMKQIMGQGNNDREPLSGAVAINQGGGMVQRASLSAGGRYRDAPPRRVR